MPEVHGGWAVTVDRDTCIGSGMCVVYAPGTFVHDDAAKAMVRTPSTDDVDAVRTAVEACPTRALRLVTERTEP
jgi:ferredoxin